MKRIIHVLYLALVWSAMVLVAVPPASACRLLRGRCCCVCCVDPCADNGCSLPDTKTPPGEPLPPDQSPPASEATPPAQRSPSDAPPGATTGAGVRSGNVATSEPTELSVPQAVTPAAPASDRAPSGTLTLGSHTAPEPSVSRTPTIVEPSVPPSTTEPIRRTPASAAPITGATEVSSPPANASTPVASSPMPTPQPLSQSLRPLQGTPATTTPAASPASGALTDAADAPTSTIRRSGDTQTTEPVSPMPPPARAVAQPNTPTTSPVAPPAFPKAEDDPFAPAKPQPAEDDPFAPLPAGNNQPKPLAAEPTNLRIAEALVPGADGRLPLREWQDNSGKFRVKAQLVLVLDGKVRLLKETGRTTTVSLERLSAENQAYVTAAVSRYGKDLSNLEKLAANTRN